ncbi:MAG: OstA-like protein [Bacteroidota bacterium]
MQLHAQKGILELLPGSDKLGYNEKTGAHRLVGSVNFNYQGNTMYCDSAHYFDKTNEVRAYGNVHILKDNINLFCDSLYYNGKTQRAKLWGHVRARDLEYKLSTDTLEYDAKKGQGIYRHGGKIESITSSEVLTSRVGYFNPDSKDFYFSGKVKYKNEGLQMITDTLRYSYGKQTTYFAGATKIIKDSTFMYCKSGWYNIKTEEGSLMNEALIVQQHNKISGDTLLYRPLIGKSIAKGHVMIEDTVKKTLLLGNYGELDEKNKSSLLTGNAIARSVRDKDTLHIFADTLFNQNDSIDKHTFTKAYNNVRFYNTAVQAKCDSLMFNSSNNSAEMFQQPIVWTNKGELKGDSMTVYLNDSIVDWIHIRNNSTVVMEVDSGNYYNQIGGKEIKAFFRDNEVYQTNVLGNATTIFYPEETEKTDSSTIIKRKGMNRLYAGELRIYLDSSEITGITYFDRPDGVFYPLSEIPKKEQFISNFQWNPTLRPKKSLLEGILPTRTTNLLTP